MLYLKWKIKKHGIENLPPNNLTPIRSSSVWVDHSLLRRGRPLGFLAHWWRHSVVYIPNCDVPVPTARRNLPRYKQIKV